MKTFATPPRPEPARTRPCALCGGSDFHALWKLEGFAFVRCAACGLVQQNPQPEPEAVLSRYGAEYLAYEIERQFAYRDLERLALADLGVDLEAEAAAARAARAMPATAAPPGTRAASAARAAPAGTAGLGQARPSVLDVGCATGALLADFAAAGWAATGVEVCAEAAAYGRARFGLDLRTGTLEGLALPSASFDLVHASHVIEHLNDPRAFLLEARRVLSPSGRLVLTTPNIAGFQARVTGAAWRSAINDHLYLFSRRQLLSLLGSSGFAVSRVVTWGGWAVGLRPAFLKKPLDRAAKRLGAGDVMAILARPLDRGAEKA